MAALSEYVNVRDTVLFVLKEKGFNLWYEDESDLYCAEKNGWDFKADSPCALLGLIHLYELRNPEKYEEYWWRADGSENEFEKLSRVPLEYVSITESNDNG